MNLYTVIIIAPVVVFSVIAVAVILERFIFLKKNNILIDYYRNNDIKDFASFKNAVLTKKIKNIFDMFLCELFGKKFKSKDSLQEYIDTEISVIAMEYNKKIYLIGVFARLSTLLGLLGTVVGMISAFNNIVEKGISNAGIVASGISTALLTTAIGLIVAIPLTFFHEYFLSRIENELKKMEIITSNMLSLLYVAGEKQERI